MKLYHREVGPVSDDLGTGSRDEVAAMRCLIDQSVSVRDKRCKSGGTRIFQTFTQLLSSSPTFLPEFFPRLLAHRRHDIDKLISAELCVVAFPVDDVVAVRGK